jgi:hypothetical protein
MPASDFRTKIKELVNAQWKATGAPLLLSKLGAALREDFDVERETSAIKLAPFLRAAMPTEIRVIQDPNNRIIVGAVPAGVDVSAETLFRKIDKPPDERRPTGNYTRYDRDLWNAFTLKLAPDKRRFLSATDQVNVAEVLAREPEPPGFAEVTADDVVALENLGPGQRFAAASDRIESWAARNAVDISKFRRVGHVGEKTVLSVLIESVAQDDLSKISLPLSVIRILQNTIAK